MHTVFPSNLFPFLVCSAVVGNANFVNPAFCFGDLGSDFRIKPKSVFFYCDILDKRSPEGFVAGFHISQVHICQHVGQQCE